jgi:hypothetical protein
MTAPRYRYEPHAAADIAPDVLQVFGVGMRIAHHPARDLWALVETGAGRLIEQPAPAGSLHACQQTADLWRSATLGDALQYWPADDKARQTFVENYPIPAMVAGPGRVAQRAETEDSNNAYFRNLQRAMQRSGLPFHRFSGPNSTISWQTGNDGVWSTVFQRFDKAGDLNSLLLWAEDGYAIRAETGGWLRPNGATQGGARQPTLEEILSRPPRAGDLSDAFVSLLLARPVAADWLRELAPHVFDSMQVTRFTDGRSGRGPHGFGRLGIEHYTQRATYQSPRTYITTDCVPEPWSSAQMSQYDDMPTLAWLHRPTVAWFEKSDAQAARVASLQQALQGALDGPLRGQPPARIMFDTGLGDAGMARMSTVRQAVKAVLPAFDLQDPGTGYNLSSRLGDCGAASAFAGVGLASLAAWETGASAMVINARRDDGATVVVVGPTNAEYRAQFKKRPYEHA